MIKAFSKATVLGAAVLFTLSLAHATPVTVNNFSFEGGTFSSNTGSGGAGQAPDFWTVQAGTEWCTVQPGTTGYPAAADGLNYLAINNGSGPTTGLYEDVGALLADTTYTLTVAIGHYNGWDNAPGIISLINGTDNTGVLLSSNSGQPASQNTWGDVTTSFTTGASVSGDLSIYVSVAPNTGYQGDFDNVRLNASPVPEPATFALLGGGLLLSLIALRRKQAC
jgi:hypothetical protein